MQTSGQQQHEQTHQFAGNYTLDPASASYYSVHASPSLSLSSPSSTCTHNGSYNFQSPAPPSYYNYYNNNYQQPQDHYASYNNTCGTSDQYAFNSSRYNGTTSTPTAAFNYSYDSAYHTYSQNDSSSISTPASAPSTSAEYAYASTSTKRKMYTLDDEEDEFDVKPEDSLANLPTQAQLTTSECASRKRPKMVKFSLSETAANASSASGVAEYQCEVCQVKCNSMARYLMHQHKYHRQGSSTQCPVCRKSLMFLFNT